MTSINKYSVAGREDENEVLPNLLNLTTIAAVSESEFVGFFQAQEQAIDLLSDETVFDVEYLYALHRDALGHLYTFAGKLRTVNISKGNFAFASASFLPQAMTAFENDFLLPLSTTPIERNILLPQIARMHAELLFIHPFREGNGRTVRLFANLLFLAKTGRELDFQIIENNIELYIQAVQQAGKSEYALMEELFLRMDFSLE